MFKLRPKEIKRQCAKDMFNRWLRGHSFEAIAADERIPIEKVQSIVALHATANWVAWQKYKLAETRGISETD
jgi:hypothetical protein